MHLRHRRPIAGSGSYSCTFTATVCGDFSGRPLEHGHRHRLRRRRQHRHRRRTRATMAFKDVLPDITVTKTADDDLGGRDRRSR